MKKIYKRVASILVGMGMLVCSERISLINVAAIGAFVSNIHRASAIQDSTPLQTEIELYLANAPDVLKWKFYLYKKVAEVDLTYRDFRRLRSLATCESSWRQYNSRGEILRGYIHPADIGLFQINIATSTNHLPNSQSLGYDVFDPYGNIDYAIWLYQEQGVKPWVCKA